MPTSRKVVLALLAIFMGALASQEAQAQVAARQGDAKEEHPNEFTSPMVLELPLEDLSTLGKNERVEYQEQIRDYFCDDVALRHLQIQPRKSTGTGSAATVTFQVRGTLYVRPSRDRLVTVELKIVQGDDVLTELDIHGIEAEEKKTKAFKSSFSLNQARMDEAFASDPAPMLRITMWVRPD